MQNLSKEALAERIMGTLHVGVDEAGRGCLAGPVVAGAVLGEPGFDFAWALPGLTDSKALNPQKREKLRQAVHASGLYWAIGVAWPQEIDEVNILNATFRAMSRAVCALFGKLQRQEPELLEELRQAAGLTGLAGQAGVDGAVGEAGNAARGTAKNAAGGAACLYIDGSQAILPPQWLAGRGNSGFELPPQKTLVKGDSILPSISAASIMAKTWRDRLMQALERRYPGYGFAAHKGYGTAEHLEALRLLGPCVQHRLTFAGVLPEEKKPAQEQFSLF